VTKSNLAAESPALAYTIDTSNGAPQVRWHGATEHTAAQLVAEHAAGDDGGALGEAKEFLTAELAHGPKPAKVVQKAARAAGIFERTLERAKAALGVHAQKMGGSSSPWCWSLPAGHVGGVGRLGDLGGRCGTAEDPGGISKTAKVAKTPIAADEVVL
jgi:hypothetical protein